MMDCLDDETARSVTRVLLYFTAGSATTIYLLLPILLIHPCVFFFFFFFFFVTPLPSLHLSVYLDKLLPLNTSSFFLLCLVFLFSSAPSPLRS